MSRRFGMDGWAIGVHAFVTICAAVAFGEAAGSADEIVIPLTFAGSAVLFEWRRRKALREQGPVGLTSGEVAAHRLADVEDRMAELDLLHARLMELEERVDFSERLLARPDQRQSAGGDHA
ncbi:MAG TPA: hypothetical protein VMK53_07985 [Gemmatimonadales bacterium]|nr:hypothetical protein [Gemmatimonadales bacterium]